MSLRSVVLSFVSVAFASVAAQDLSSDALPAGMTREQAVELAKKNGISSGSTGASSNGIPGATKNAVSVVPSDVSPDEGDVAPRANDDDEDLAPDDADWNFDPEAGPVSDSTGRAVGRSSSKDSLGRKEASAKAPPSRSKPKAARKFPPPLVRYGQSIFRHADPSLFASHVGAVGAGYQLGPGDELIVTLWGQKDARYQVALDRDGQASIEGIGVVSLNGQTLGSATDLIRSRLRRIYSGIGSGGVGMDVTLGKLKQIRVFVVGDVVRQGGYMLSGNTSVLAAIYQAKGPTDIGSEREIEVVRGKVRTKVDLYDYFFRGQKPAGDVLHDGDVVRIPSHGPLVAIRGDVGRPAIYELKGKEGAKELLEYAGGVNATAANSSLNVLRVFENGRLDAVSLPSPSEVAAGAAAALQGGDTVYVVHGKDPSSATVVVGGEVRFPGALPFVAEATAADFLEKAGGPTRDAYVGRVLLSRRLSDGDREQLRFSLESASTVKVQAQDSIKVYDVTKISLRDSIRISGAVRRPGIYARPEGMTVKDLILKAGGFRWGADWKNVRLESPMPGSDESKIDVLALDSSLAVATADRIIPPHAHVAVPLDPLMDTLQMVNVRGLVSRPGRYALEHNGERLSSLWERLGGLRPDAYLAGARLIRGDGTGRIQIDFERALKDRGGYDDIPLRGGDTIYVPMRPATVAVLGRVNTPANVVWREGKGWKWYIEQVGGFTDSADEDKVFVRFADGSVQTRESGISNKPNPGSEIVIPFRRPPEPTTGKDVLSGMNMIMATVIAGLTIFVLIKNN